MSLERRRARIAKKDSPLSIRRQCRILDLGRSTYYYRPQGESGLTLELMRRIDELFMECPFYGSRQMRNSLCDLDYPVGRKRVRRLMRKMGLMAIYRKPKTSQPHPDHKVYPYLLRNLKIERPNQVWCADITYIPMRRGFMYLVAIMDWHTRRCCPGDYPTPWRPTSAWTHLMKPITFTGRRRYSTPTGAANSPAVNSPKRSRIQEPGYPWTAGAADWAT